ncbi:MAG: ligase-associated DNA damage response endonuclease PdeM [Bradymonadaceae bacterium]
MDEHRLTVEIPGEQLVVCGERGIWWPAASVLLVADVHVGRIAAGRARGAAVPGDSLGATLEQLGRLIDRTDPDRVVVLGDFVQDRAGLNPRVVERVGAAISTWSAPLELVPGNHDRRVGPLPEEWPVTILEPVTRLGPFVLRHEPEPTDGGYVLAGHYHPTVRLEAGRDQLRLPCFAFGDRVGISPAFHAVTNGVEMAIDEYRLVAVADGKVVDLES